MKENFEKILLNKKNAPTIEEFDNAIDYLLPNIKKAKENDIKFNRPDLVKMVAEKYFLDSMRPDCNHDSKTKSMYKIIHFSAMQLNTFGTFNFKS